MSRSTSYFGKMSVRTQGISNAGAGCLVSPASAVSSKKPAKSPAEQLRALAGVLDDPHASDCIHQRAAEQVAHLIIDEGNTPSNALSLLVSARRYCPDLVKDPVIEEFAERQLRVLAAVHEWCPQAGSLHP